MECRAYGICLDSQSRGYLGKDRKVSSAAGGNLSRMHKTQETAKESRLNFMYSHLRNRTLANERRRRITASQTAVALNLVQELPLLFDSQPDSDTTMQLARAHKLTVYDAVYLELAVRRHLALVTFDAALAEAATRINVSNP